MNYTFDGTNKIITLGAGAECVVQDLYSRWVDWVLTSDNSKYLPVFRVVGGDPLPGSKSLGLTYFLVNDWKIRPDEANYALTVTGNLYCEDGSSPFIATLGYYNVLINMSTSTEVTQVDSGSSPLTTEEHDRLYAMATEVKNALLPFILG